MSWTAIACCLVAACGGSDLVLPSSSLPAVIRVVDGDGQSGSVGQLLPAPIVVEVTDSRGKEVEGIAVEFALTSAGAGAEIVPATATTDAKGQAQARVLLGSKVGVQTGEARVTLGGGTAVGVSAAGALVEALGRTPEATPDFLALDRLLELAGAAGAGGPGGYVIAQLLGQTS